MSKRILAASVGFIAVFAGIVACYNAVEATAGINLATSFWFAAVWLLVEWSVTLAVLILGLRFLRFAWTNKSESRTGWMKAVLLGIGFFFPGFVFSYPFTLIWAWYTRHGDESAPAAMQVSCYVGIAAAIVCCVVLLKKRKTQAVG
jgi:hypothetical protein